MSKMRKKVKIDYTVSGYTKFAKGYLVEDDGSFITIELFDGTERMINKENINEMAELREDSNEYR